MNEKLNQEWKYDTTLKYHEAIKKNMAYGIREKVENNNCKFVLCLIGSFRDKGIKVISKATLFLTFHYLL